MFIEHKIIPDKFVGLCGWSPDRTTPQATIKFILRCWNLKMAKILIVDDSAFARNMLRMVVESGGHEVVGRAGDGEQALKLFKSLKPELVTLDSLMPNKSGEVVLKEIMQHDPRARVIMITGWANNTIEEIVMQAGAKAFLEKPNVKKDLVKVIDQVMEI